MTADEVIRELTDWAVAYPDYQVVICNCIDCIGLRAQGQKRPVDIEAWRVNHATKRIYL